jgi:hypothetical protein
MTIFRQSRMATESEFKIGDPSQQPPWPEPVDGAALLDELAGVLRRFVILPRWGPETLALWILHTYAFQLRDVTTYLGIESPAKRCGKTTLLGILAKLVHRPILAANISSTAFFRVIQEMSPTLLMDEVDNLLRRNDEMKGLLNSGYSRDTAYVVRVASPAKEDHLTQLTESTHLTPYPSTRLAFFSCWCPKVMATIGRLPDTLADRCIIIRMQRKNGRELCERLRNLDSSALSRQCARFVLDRKQLIASAHPDTPSGLNDRAADIWEPLFALADLAGGHWPDLARQAATSLSTPEPEANPIGALLLDIFLAFDNLKAERLFTRDLLDALPINPNRPWQELLKGSEPTERWLALQLRPFAIRPRTLWIAETQAKGYYKEDFVDACSRYVTKSQLEALAVEPRPSAPPADGPNIVPPQSSAIMPT